VSHYDIHRGTRFLEEIDRALIQCKAGIICLTPENKESVWVAFEAGALASRVASSRLVIPLVSRMRPTDIQGPIGMFQACQLTKSDMLDLVKALNSLNTEEDIIAENRLTATFEGVWPEFERQISALEEEQAASGNVEPPRRSNTELIEEILDVTKSIRILVEDQARDPIATAVAAGETETPEASAQEAMTSGAGLEGRESFPELADAILSASVLWLAGISLQAVMRQYFVAFSESVGHEKLTLRFLVLDLTDDFLMEVASRSLYGVSSPDDLRQDVATAVAQIAQLQSFAHSKSAVQIRYMRNLPSTSLIMANPLSGNGTAIAEFYPYRASSSDRPHIFLNESGIAERKWFVFYREQFLSIWRDARKPEEGENDGS
jgi:hypothetical protein